MRSAFILLVLAGCTGTRDREAATATETATATATETATATATATATETATAPVPVPDAAPAPVPAPAPAPVPDPDPDPAPVSLIAFPALDADTRTFIILAPHPTDPPEDTTWTRRETPLGDILLTSPELPLTTPRTFTFPSLGGPACVTTARARVLVAHGVGESDHGWEHTGATFDALVVDGCADDDDARRIAVEGERPAARLVEAVTLEDIADENAVPRRLAALDPAAPRAERRAAAWLLRASLPGTGLQAVDAGPFPPISPTVERNRLRLVSTTTGAIAGTWDSAFVRAVIVDGPESLVAIDVGPERIIILQAHEGTTHPLVDATWPIGDFGCDC